MATGSSFSDAKVAVGIMPLLVMPFMLFAGLYANESSIPVWIRWFQYVSPFKYAYEAAITNEF